MKRVETEIYAPVPEKPGCVKCVGRKKVAEVFEKLKKELQDQGLLPDEYFLLDNTLKDEFPEISDIICHTNWGGSEGIYLDIDLIVFTESGRSNVHFITGKTLDESSAGFDKMNYTAGYIYRLFMGDGATHARYYKIQAEASTIKREKFHEIVTAELQELLKRYLFHSNEAEPISMQEIALKTMIVSVLENYQLSEDKMACLVKSGNILKILYSLCKPVIDPTIYEIEDILASYRVE
ncbi:MAG: hypothetical protein PHW34_13455 [Hespellia sp.]|nr:hypothetical protein [Hespellia sp.]